MTNYEKIKQMTVENMTEFLNDITFFCRYDECDKCPINKYKSDVGCGDETIKNWLKQEAEK